MSRISGPVQQPQSRPATAARRRAIIEAAIEVFGSKGFTGGTLADVGAHVGMTHAGVLHHFRSKEQLLLEMLKYRDAVDVEAFEDQHIPGGAALFEHLIETALRNAERVALVQAYVVLSADSITEDHPAREYFESRYRILRREVAEAFEVMCQEKGVHDDEQIKMASASILAVMDGLQYQWLLAPDTLDLGKATKFAIESIVTSVVGPPDAD
ncbi:transcriptional regulator, TetR family [Micrococcales bacterium KH10]|nr:transcriptional regulator, TetR family [Micrococcales bacterium KH10]